MTVDIEKLEALAKNATPGPWWIDSHGMTMMSMDKLEVVFNHPAQGVAVRNEDTGNLSHWRNDWDASFIAAANPAAVLELIADFKSTAHDHELLRAENEALRKDASIQDLLCCNVCRCMIQPANKLQAENDRLKDENEALRKDAERYQWLRGESESVHQFYLSTPIWFTGVKFSKENVDSTIDAAMSKEQSHD